MQLAKVIVHKSKQSGNRFEEAVAVTPNGHEIQVEQRAHPITISIGLARRVLMGREVLRGVGRHNYGVRASECSVV